MEKSSRILESDFTRAFRSSSNTLNMSPERKKSYFFCFHLFSVPPHRCLHFFQFFVLFCWGFFCFSGVFYPSFHWTVKPLFVFCRRRPFISVSLQLCMTQFWRNCKDMKNNFCFRVVCISCKGGTERYLVF